MRQSNGGSFPQNPDGEGESDLNLRSDHRRTDTKTAWHDSLCFRAQVSSWARFLINPHIPPVHNSRKTKQKLAKTKTTKMEKHGDAMCGSTVVARVFSVCGYGTTCAVEFWGILLHFFSGGSDDSKLFWGAHFFSVREEQKSVTGGSGD